MGNLFRFEIERYAESYDLPVLFETGTFTGKGVKLALEAGFGSIFSVEIVEQYYKANAELFADRPEVKIIEGESVDALNATLPTIEANILFWLDAHFPGADGGLSGYNDCKDESVRCPLERELKMIRGHRPGGKDVFIIDDLNLYETGDFKSGPRPEHIYEPFNKSLDYIDELFSDTHHIVRIYDDEGYLLLLPNSLPPKLYLRRSLAEVMANAGVEVNEVFAAAFNQN